MKDVLNIGVLGCGTIVQYAHLPAISRTTRVRLVALCDSSKDLLMAVGGKVGSTKVYLHFAEMLSDPEVQAVLIAVPDPLHVPLTLQALRAGKHVLVEKPMGISTVECRQVCQQVQSTNLKVQVGSMKRHDPGVRFAREFIAERVGPVFSVAGLYRDSLYRPAMQESCLDPIFVGSSPGDQHVSNYKSNREHYNLWTQGAHLFDTIRYLAGDVAAVTAQIARQNGQCSWHGLLEFTLGGQGHFELTCKSCGDWWEQYTVYGEKGSVDVRVNLPFYHRPAQVKAFDGRHQQWQMALGARSNAYVNQLEDFANSVLDDRVPSPNALDGMAVVRLLEAVEQSVLTNKRIEITPCEVSECA